MRFSTFATGRAGKRMRVGLTGRVRVAVWVALIACGAALAFVARGRGPLPGDLLFSRFVQELPMPGGLVGALFSNVDSAVWLILATALTVMLVLRSWSSALFIFVASFSSVLLGVALKLIVARPRPTAELVQVYDTSQSYSFPSITAFFSLVLLGVIAFLIWRRDPPRPVLPLVLGVSLVLVLVMGLSRVYVGEHWPSDVLGGWIFGAVWLLTLMKMRWNTVRGRV